MIRFESSVVVITGGSSGIGKEIAHALWREGATVCLVGRDRNRLDAAATFDAFGRERVRCYPLDITRDGDVRSLAATLEADFNRVDVLVHSAGAFVYGDWESLSLDDLDLLYKTNLRAPVLLTQALLPMLKNSHGQIVLINSSAARNARAKTGAYSATKLGLIAFADSLREEVNPAGVRVISVYPGRTATPMQEFVCRVEGSEYKPERLLQPEDVATVVLNAMGLGRSAEVTDLHIRPMIKPS